MKHNLRIVFLGTPDFAVATLNAVIEEGYNVVGVVTAPDKPAGRGKKISESAVKKYAVEKGLNILQPVNLKDQEFQSELKSLNADLQIVVAFRMLPETVWNMPPLGTFNLHASLLPQYRGAAPINWAVINGEKSTGVTTFFLKHEIDTGNVLMQKEVEILENDNAGTLHDKLMETGAKLVVESLDIIEKGDYNLITQESLVDGHELKHAPKIFKEDCRINWNQNGEIVNNFIRGLSPYPTAWTNFSKEGNEVAVKIFKASFEKASDSIPGELYSDNKKYLKIGVQDGYIQIDELQMAGKKRMKVQDFLAGYNAV
jgi:methionyl-tRNA formyltransferase